MKVKQVCQATSTYVLVLASGDEVTRQLLQFANDQRPAGASFTAIGAFEHCKLGYFDWQAKKYLENPIDEQVGVMPRGWRAATIMSSSARA